MLQKPLVFHGVRTLVIILITLIIVHFFVYTVMPWEEGYLFPLKSSVTLFLFGMSICSVNWIVHTHLRFKQGLKLIHRILIITGVTVLSYTVLYYLINVVVMQYEFSAIGYVKFLFIILLVMTTEYSLVALSAFKSVKNERHHKLLIETGRLKIAVDPSEIICFKTHSKIIKVYMRSNKSYLTQFNSLEEVAETLNGVGLEFFQINRQFLINKHSVSSVKKHGDRKLRITLDSVPDELCEEDISVSRHRNKDFHSWLTGTSHFITL